jgi:regulator of protease activity HflC (stomatin/prohibitin superfamily)
VQKVNQEHSASPSRDGSRGTLPSPPLAIRHWAALARFVRLQWLMEPATVLPALDFFLLWPVLVGVIVAVYLLRSIRVLNEYERGVVFRLGHVQREPRAPGLTMIFGPFERMVRVSLRTHVNDVPPQDIITKDNVSVSVNAVVYSRVVDPIKAILEVEDFRFATSELSQTTLRSVLGQVELDELLAERDRLNLRLRETIDQQSDPWGIKINMVEVKHVDLPEAMKRAMAQQAESERDRRAKVIHAEGEFQASARLRDAAEVMKDHPMAMQMRFLQTLSDVGAEKNTTIVFPIPIDLLSAFMKAPAVTDTGAKESFGGRAPISGLVPKAAT